MMNTVPCIFVAYCMTSLEIIEVCKVSAFDNSDGLFQVHLIFNLYNLGTGELNPL